METWRAGDTSVERLSWSSAWMASVEGWWVEGGEDEGGGSVWEMAFMPSEEAERDMFTVEYGRRFYTRVYLLVSLLAGFAEDLPA